MSSKTSTGTSSTAKAAAIALKSSVVMGGTAILSAVNGLTPHMAGAIDIMVVQQPDGTLKCSPFYVRFGKYAPMRSKDKRVQILINGEEAAINMHLGAYGQAYFAAETMEIVSDADDEELLQGMMSPPSGYSSDEGAPYANEEILSAVQQEVQRIKTDQGATTATAVAVTAAVVEGGAATAAGAGIAEQQAAGAALLPQRPLESLLSGAAADDDMDSGTESDTESSSGLDDVSLSAAEVAQAIQQGLADGAAAAGSSLSAAAAALDAGAEMPSSSGSSAVLGVKPSSSRRRSKPHRHHVLAAPGDGAADDPTRAAFQDLLLDNKYSFKVKSDESFVTEGLDGGAAAAAAARQNKPRSKSRLQQQQRLDSGDLQQLPAVQEQQLQYRHRRKPVRHVGFEVSSPQSTSNTVEASAAGGGAACSGDMRRQIHQAELAAALDSAASYSVAEETQLNSSAAGAAGLESEGSVTSPSSAGAAAAMQQQPPPLQQASSVSSSSGLQEMPTLSDNLQQSEPDTAAEQQLPLCHSRSREGLLASSLKAAHQPEQPEQQQGQQREHQKEQQQQAVDQQNEQQQALDKEKQPDHPSASEEPHGQEVQQEEHHVQLQEQLQQSLSEPQQQQQQQQAAELVQQQPSGASTSSRSSQEVDQPDATAILEGGAVGPALGRGSMLQELHSIAPPVARLPDDLNTAAAAADGNSSLQPSTPRKAAQEGPATLAAAAAAAADEEEEQTSTAAKTPPAAGATPAAAEDHCGDASQPVAVPASSGPAAAAALARSAASPPVDSGYLGDNEQGGPLGTSYDGAGTPTAGGMPDLGSSGSGPLALRLSGFQLSLCGSLLRPDMAVGEVQQVFETQRVAASTWAERGVSLMSGPDLVVKIGGSIYSWQVAAPMVVGMLAFGGKWDSLLGLDPTGMYPIKLADDHSSTAKKVGLVDAQGAGASSSWRLWPFTGWREAGSGSNKSAPALGSSPPAGAAAAAAAGGPSAGGSGTAGQGSELAPSGGSFSNLLALMGGGVPAVAVSGGSSTTPAPLRLDMSAPGSLSTPAVLDGGSPRALSIVAGSSPRVSRKKHIIIIRKTLTPTSDQLSKLPLKLGSNTITFRASGVAELTAYIYLLRWNTRLVVSDVDGTITRSDLLGHVLPPLGVDWSHPGITQLFHNIDSNGYQIMFLSSRAIAQANITREYLHRLVQDGYKMPAGPVIISPHGLLPSLYREIVVRRPHEFKIACLQDIRALFPADWNPFYAGFGNRDTDEVSYREVGVPLSRTFTINPKGQIQKAAAAVQSSTWSSLSAINELVDELFPPLPAAASRSSSRALRSQQSSRRINDWEYAAAAGIVAQDTIEAAVAEQERRRSGSSLDGGVSRPAAAAGGGEAAAGAAAGAGSKPATGGSIGTAAQIVADATAAGTTSVYATPVASASGAAAAPTAVEAAVVSAPALEMEDVTPPREEFADLQYWKPLFSVDIGDELMRVENQHRQQQQQQQLQQQSSQQQRVG